MVADDHNAAVDYTLTVTHEGGFEVIEPTGKIELRDMQIGRFEKGQLVERWGSSDELGILQQLGAESKAKGGWPSSPTSSEPHRHDR